MTTSLGVNEKSATATSAVVGGVVANSVKSAGLGTPLTVALTRWMVDEPTESLVLATPLASVVLCAGFTAPPPDDTVHVTATPGTARPLTSSTVTLKGVGNGLLKYQLCPAPPLGNTSAGGEIGRASCRERV